MATYVLVHSSLYQIGTFCMQRVCKCGQMPVFIRVSPCLEYRWYSDGIEKVPA